MRVLQVGLGDNPGGVETFAMNYARKLADKGVVFDFISMYGGIAYADEIRQLGGEIFLIPNIKKNYFGYVNCFRKILQNGGYDVVHVNMLSAANIVPLRLAKAAGVKRVIAHSHNESTPGLVRKIMHYMNRAGIGYYANVKLACSIKAAKFLFGKHCCRKQEVIVIKNAIDVECFLFSELEREKMRSLMSWNKRLVIGHVGRFGIQKNHSAIVEIFREILKYEPRAILCLVGDGELRKEIERRLKEYGIYDHVYFAGVQSEVWKFLSAMDVFLLPSLFEGLPFALIEAQANGLPCVVSDVVSKEAIITDRVRKLSLQQSYAEWAKEIIDCSNRGREDKEYIQSMIREAHFDIEKESERLLCLYQG